MERVLYLSYDGLTDPLGQSQILPYLEGLGEKGYSITLISFEKPDRYAKRKGLIEERCKLASIEWRPLAYTKSPPVASTLKDLRTMRNEVEDAYRKENFQLIHCRSYLTALVALELKEKFGIPFLFDMRGFWADERVDGNIWNLNNPLYKHIYRYFKLREKTFLEKADGVVSLTEAGKEEIQNWFNNDPLFGGGEYTYNYDRAARVAKKTEVIPCSSDLSHFDFNRISENKKEWLGAVHGIDTQHEYLGYVGSLGTWYMGKEMIDLYKVVLESRPNLRFLILSHDDLTSLREYAESLNIPRSYLIQVEAERKEVPALMSLMSASVFFILPAYSKKASSPTKQGELMAMGVPVICNAGVGDSAEIVEKYQAGKVIRAFNTEAYREVARDWDRLISKDKSAIRRGAEEYFSLDKGIESYAALYRKILDK